MFDDIISEKSKKKECDKSKREYKTCISCGKLFTGDYCPDCNPPASTKKITTGYEGLAKILRDYKEDAKKKGMISSYEVLWLAQLRYEQWLLIEELEEIYPYWRWGWNGLVPMMIFTDNC